MAKRMTNYQVRVTKAVWASSAYSIASGAAVWWYDLGHIGWLVWLSTGAVLYSVAALADAVHDSLSERLNIQSSWLDVRLAVLERATKADSGQAAWLRDAIATDDPSNYFYGFPEQKFDSTA